MKGKVNFGLVFFLIFITAFLGCGGDGGSNGGGDNTNPPINNEEDIIAPSVPTELTSTPVSESQINLSWNISTDNVAVAGYKLYRDGTYLKSITEGTTCDTSDTGLSASLEYCYTVSAYDEAENESEQSSEVCAVASAPFWLKISEIEDFFNNTNECIKDTSNGFIFWWESRNLHNDNGLPLKRSTDNGLTWENVLSPGYYKTISRLDEDKNGYLYIMIEDEMGENNKLYRSIDNGDNWTAVLSSQFSYMSGCWKIVSLNTDALLCFLSGGSISPSFVDLTKLYQSVDSGNSWTIINALSELKYLYNIKITTSKKIFVVDNEGSYKGDDSYYYYSIDNGNTWTKRITTESMIYVLFSSINLPTGEMIGWDREEHQLYISSDEGENWTKINSNIDYQTELKTVNSDGDVFAVNLDGDVFAVRTIVNDTDYIYRSNDKGITWFEVDSGGLPQSISISSFLIKPDGYIYFLTQGGGIYRSSKSTIIND